MDSHLKKLLDVHKKYFALSDDGRVTCLANGHSFPQNFAVVHAFISGKRFPKLCKRFDAEQGLAQFEPFITQSKNFPSMLYCTLTGQLMEKSLAAVKKHQEGKKYVFNKGKYDKGIMTLRPEPSIEDVLARPKSKKSTEGKGEEAASEEEAEDEEATAKRRRVQKTTDEMSESGDEEEGEEEEAGGGDSSSEDIPDDGAMEESEDGFEFSAGIEKPEASAEEAEASGRDTEMDVKEAERPVRTGHPKIQKAKQPVAPVAAVNEQTGTGGRHQDQASKQQKASSKQGRQGQGGRGRGGGRGGRGRGVGS